MEHPTEFTVPVNTGSALRAIDLVDRQFFVVAPSRRSTRRLASETGTEICREQASSSQQAALAVLIFDTSSLKEGEFPISDPCFGSVPFTLERDTQQLRIHASV